MNGAEILSRRAENSATASVVSIRHQSDSFVIEAATDKTAECVAAESACRSESNENL
jgi:hypothetical protein